MAEQAQALEAPVSATPQTLEGETLLESIIEDTRARAPEERERTRSMIADLIQEVMQGAIVVDRDLEASIKSRIGQLDALISDQLNAVMHAAPFQKLEASWRGLHGLVHQTETSERLQIRVLNASRRELQTDLERAPEFDQSTLFKKVYGSEYGTFGGTPYGLLVGDFEFGRSPQDVALLERISTVAAAAHAPFIAGTAADMFNLDSFEQLEAPRDLARIFAQPEYIPWRSFRDSEDSRYVGLVLPHYLVRLPYGRNTTPVDAFDFQEDVDGTDSSRYLWGNAAYLLASRFTSAFAEYGWCTRIRGPEGGGRVDGLPAHIFRTEKGATAMRCPTEVSIDERRERELSDLGFISLVHCKNTDYAVFFSGQSANRPKKYLDDDATGSADLSAKLPYVMATSRFAHYLKAIVRDKIGGFESRTTLQSYLERWINQFVLLDDNAPATAKARRPLREAKVLVEEVPGQPGAYQARVWLKPHYQLEAMAVSLRLATRLPDAAR